MTRAHLLFSSIAASALLAIGCIASPVDRGEGEEENAAVEYDAPFTSDRATLMNFEFDGEMTSASSTGLTAQIKTQMFYTVGHLNGEDSVARLDRLKLTNVTVVSAGGGLYRIRYRAKLPVAWGSKTNLPTTYQLSLPKRADGTGQSAFLTKYGSTCNDGDDHSVTASNYWYHYRPKAFGCTLDAADVMRATATTTVSTENTVAKYPEYHRIWEDGRFDVVAIFGKYEDYATSNGDAGIAAYNEFIGAMKAAYPSAVTTPASVAANPGVATPDITFNVTLAGGKTMQVTALLIDGVRTAPASFAKRYAELAPGADMIGYYGHAGLGANIKALSTMGKFFPGKYQLFFMNGCDTFAYADETLATQRKALNSDDPTGTKYMDMLTNAMPAYFMHMSDAGMALIKSLANPSQPKSYVTIFKDIDPSQVVVVTGEEDNVFHASYAWPNKWRLPSVSGAANDNQVVDYPATETLPAGKYTFTMTPDFASPGGDADLYVRVGAAPTVTSTYKCQSYVYNSNERCVVTLTAPSKIYFKAVGDKAGVSSKYRIDAWQQ